MTKTTQLTAAAIVLSSTSFFTLAKSEGEHIRVDSSQFKAVNAELNEALNTWQQSFNLPSLVIAVSIEGQTVFNQAVGLADIESGRAATTRTPYSVGSIAKSMTSLAMARLVEQNKLALHAPIEQYGSYQNDWQALTSYQLASHTAGIVHYNKARVEREFESVRDHWLPQHAFDVFADEPLAFKAGSGFQYSSSGYILLSDVLAKAANTPYLQLMRQEVFAPLKMQHTLFDSSLANSGKEAVYYAPVKLNEPDNKARQRDTAKRDRSFLFGGGGYQSTASDLVNMAWYMTQDDYLTDATRALLTTPVTLPDGKANPQNYGLGWRIHDMDVSQYIPGKAQQIIKGVHHGGTTANAANAYVLSFPEFGASIAYTTNSIPSSEDPQANLQVQMWLWLYRYVEALKLVNENKNAL